MTTGRATTRHERAPRLSPSRPLVLMLLAATLALGTLWLQACDSSGDSSSGGGTTSSTSAGSSQSGDIRGVLGEDITVGDALITVRALQSTFQPAMPAQRLNASTPSAPGVGESFYQAYVRVTNTEVTPLRVDPEDFLCRIGDKVVSIEPTRSGPAARSLLKNTSLDLLLTFKGPAGFQPDLIYDPPWYNGMITIGPAADEQEVEETTST